MTYRILLCAFMLAGCGASTVETGPSSGGGGAGAEGGAGGDGGGDTCGGAICGDNERCYQACDLGEAVCGFGNITCGEHDMGACGCDGNAYETLCDMDAAGIRQGTAGSCEPPAGKFACDGLLCRAADQLCAISSGSPYCYGRDTACGDCSCVDVSDYCSGTGTCEDVSGGGISVTCD